MGAGKVTRVRGRIAGGVAGATPPGPEWDELGHSMGGHQSPPPDPRLYKVYLPWTSGFEKCPVESCGGWVSTSTNLRIHFVKCHIQGKIVILEEGNHPHPC